VIAWRASVSKGKGVKVQTSNACNLDAINLANDIDVKVMLLVPASEKTLDFLKNAVTSKDDMESVYLHIRQTTHR